MLKRTSIYALAAAVLTGAVPLRAETPAIVQAMQLASDAAAVLEAKDPAAAVEKLEAAVALRPDFPRMLVDLAAAQVAAERPDDAMTTLHRFAALGLSSSFEKNDEFAALGEREDFRALTKALARHADPKGSGEIAFSLRDVTGLIEGIAWRQKTGQFYFSDVNGRAVWTRAKDGKLQRFSPEGDELLGVFGLAIDEANGALWAATSAVPAMRGFSPEQEGEAALAELDLETGAVRRIMAVPRGAEGEPQPHLLGDLALGPDGAVFVTDSSAPVLWRLAPGANALEPFVESPEFLSLQGAVIAASGAALVLSDRINGLLRVDLDTRAVQRIEAPESTTLIGIDGLAIADGDLLAIQNGVRPNRVLRIQLDAAAESVSDVTVLESGHLTMGAPSLGCVATSGDLFFVGNAGWSRFEGSDGSPTKPRAVPIFKTKLKTGGK